MGKVLPYSIFRSSERIFEKKISSFYNDQLNPVFWSKKESKNGEIEWIFDERIRKKLLRISYDFFKEFEEILKKKDIIDIQLSGSLANYNYTNLSDIDVQIIVSTKNVSDDSPEVVKEALNGIRFKWNLSHDISIRGYDLEMYIQEPETPHLGSGLFSLLNNKWIKNPPINPPEVDELDVEQKYQSIAYEVDQLESRLVSLSSVPNNAKALYNRANMLKKRITKMRKEGLSKNGEFSVGNLTYKKLRNEGYIEKLIHLISKSYDKIYTEK